ncbi:MAG: cbb3-type cytochrome c oxidase subunit 3 [Proteobacteria bacterium]|nr:cbb3-type cytochrome c oxidase subunit 3 [Pseudomonadota bacterium]
MDHDTFVAFAKSWGLFYLMAMAAGVLLYVFWPSNRRRFDLAKNSILDGEDRPGSKSNGNREA